MDLIIRIASTGARTPLTRLVREPIGLDIWETKPDYLVARASEAQAERLRQVGYAVEQLARTDAYVAEHTAAASAAALSGETYHSAATLETDLRALEALNPTIAVPVEIGRSVEDRPIWALRIGERRGSARKLLFTGCHHAREWISVEVPYLLADFLVNNASVNPVKTWLSQGEIWVVPMVNPDGHELTRTPGNRLWRKNRRPNADGSVGVDPNRNYGYMWGVLDVSTSSHVPSDDTYVGPRAFSEPEVRAIRDLVACQRIRGIISYHSFSQLILYPWGYTDDPIVDTADRQAMVRLARRMAQLIRGVHGRVYTPQQSSDLYPTAGDTTDWTYGEQDIPSFTIELRPASFEAGGFILPPSEIAPTWEENKPAAMEFIRRVL